MNYRIVAREHKYDKIYYVQRNKFWRWVNLDAYGNPAKYPKFYKDFDSAYDSLVEFKTTKEDIVIYMTEDIENKSP
jgi:hypothetical protein